MQYLISVIDDTAGLATPDEMATIDVFNERLQADGHWVFAGGLAAPGSSTVVDGRGDGAPLVTDGPYAEAKEVIGGWAIVSFDSEEEARAEGQKMADLHLQHWPGWEGAVEIRRIAEPDEAPTGT